MNILMSCNSNYFNPTLVTMYSVLKNNPCPVTFYILHSSLTDNEIGRMKEMVEDSGHGTVEPVSVSADHFAGKNSNFSWLSQETYYRLLAQKLLPESVDRFLWLDSDIIVKGNIEEFYNQNFEGMLLCACSYGNEGETNDKLLQITLPEDTMYFNSGVYLADLAAQRMCIDPDIYENYLRLFEKRLRFADQDILNAVFYRQVKYADWRLYDFVPRRLEGMTRQERSHALNNCKIIHYNGGNSKPWQGKCVHLASDIFWKYAEDLPEYEGKYTDVKSKQRASRANYLRRVARAKAKWQKKKDEAEREKRNEEKK